MTQASIMALDGLRDLSSLQWYAIPLLAIVFYIYSNEFVAAKREGDYRILISGAAIFFADIINETLNGWILNLTGRSALWTAPGPTALRTMVGLNIEIMFMFALLGIVYWKTVDEEPRARVLGIPNRWFWAAAYSLLAVVIEIGLNSGGLLVWEYEFWNASFLGAIPIFFLGYFWFFAIAKFAAERKTLGGQVAVVGVLAGSGLILNVIGALVGVG